MGNGTTSRGTMYKSWHKAGSHGREPLGMSPSDSDADLTLDKLPPLPYITPRQ